MDGVNSNIFFYFKSLLLRGLIELRKYVSSLSRIIEIMSKGSKMPCFISDINIIIIKFKERFHLNKCESEYINVVDDLINSSLSNWRTVQYDNFQKYTNDIRP
jgi:phosphatidylinositol kinase/protein kinase (PI-3  family)